MAKENIIYQYSIKTSVLTGVEIVPNYDAGKQPSSTVPNQLYKVTHRGFDSHAT